MSEMPGREETIADVPVVIRRRKRPDAVADQIRDRIVEHGLSPGDRLPHEWIEPEAWHVSRGTLREALKVLESQGLTLSKTGPGGGVFVASVEAEQAIRLLDNLFLHQPPSIAEIYAIRKELEPLLAASLAGKLTPPAFALLQAKIRLYEDEPATVEEEYRQRMAELDFHDALARLCENRLLGFLCRFLVSLLKDMAACRDVYQQHNPVLRETGLHYQVALLRAIKAGDAERASTIMRHHMIAAEIYMLERTEIRRGHASR
ncbi:FadR family transcriptional regulator [Phyllobacterium phragmitis]|uniref:FadR family transcriptional regulator n=1 Tax=Phyllobacterium phragmitis TaxID=2670329 RepID=A0A2S9IQZ6_9HYPH|nr:FCD domain-containing protein [Phyllobacterium phragmitis]PRD42939.1 FadR family transcriptional regulator [Phyllobacterium phragmitis]